LLSKAGKISSENFHGPCPLSKEHAYGTDHGIIDPDVDGPEALLQPFGGAKYRRCIRHVGRLPFDRGGTALQQIVLNVL
jgi:hypothetical protein